MRLAIVGTAGRRDDAARLNADMWLAMRQKLLQVIDCLQTEKQCTVTDLISGGAAWGDHLAVDLFITRYTAFQTLTLCLPCDFDLQYRRYYEIAKHRGRVPGRILNYYHHRFSAAIKTQSLAELALAIQHDQTKCVISDGLFARNTEIANRADALVAFTFGNRSMVKPGGTADTVAKFKRMHPNAPTYHVDLNTMLAWRDAKVV